jgi:hypothetical protein
VEVCRSPHAVRLSPRINGALQPSRRRNRPHAALIADEVQDAPSFVALLDVLER